LANGTAARGRRIRLRALWLAIHKWIGLSLGLVIAIIGLTGSILVFYQEIDEWLNPELYAVSPPYAGASFRSTDEILSAAKAVAPDGGSLGFTVHPPHPGAAYMIYVTRPRPASAYEDIWQIFVDPYTAKVTGTRDVRTGDQWVARAFIPFVFDLHLSLLMPYHWGKTVVGMIAICVVLSLLTAIALWWPPPGKWRRALSGRRGASSQRFIYDLHQVFGIYPWIILLAVFVSGIWLNLPGTFLSAVRIFSPATIDASAFRSAPTKDAEAITIGAAIAIAGASSVEGRVMWFSGAGDPEGTHWICKNGQISISRIFDVRCFFIDQYDGQILFTEDVVTGTAGNAFIAWQWPLHSGQAFGMTGRILVLLSGLACVGLFVTGVLRWVHKRRARHRSVRVLARLS
jgi:uncharacterized iron-regulated membrane protein